MEPADWQVQVFFDGACPLCRREINLIRRWDRRGRIWFTDIADADFHADAWGIDQKTLMDSMHVRLRDGSWVMGVEAFRRMYGLIGFAWVIPLTRLPGISQLLDLAYRIFAKNRLKWTGRCEPDGVCRVDPPIETGGKSS